MYFFWSIPNVLTPYRECGAKRVNKLDLHTNGKYDMISCLFLAGESDRQDAGQVQRHGSYVEEGIRGRGVLEVHAGRVRGAGGNNRQFEELE